MDITRLTIHETLDLLNQGELSVFDVAQTYTDRIKSLDGQLDAFLLDHTAQALEAAKAMDQKGRGNASLAGIPYALKDNICTNGIRTTAASKILGNFVPPYNADVYNRLSQSGAVMLGKVNMDEFAMGSSTENSAYQTTKNPWDFTKVPGGSSGGSAVAVAADMAAFSLGSDTGGSIRQPASLCGVVGLKPTYGLVSRYGLIAFASSLDQIGPFTKDVEDAAIVLNAIAGHDTKDSTSLNIPKKDYLVGLKDGVQGMKIGVMKSSFDDGVQLEVQKAVNDASDAYRAAGAEIVEVDFHYLKQALAVYYIIACAEASSNLARYDGVRYGVRAEEYIDYIDMYYQTRTQGFGEEVKRRIMLGTYALSSGYYDAYYKKAMQVRTLIVEDFKSVFAQCDVMLTPTSASTAFGIGEKIGNPLDMYLNDIFTVPMNIAGVPGISLPTALDDAGLPIGIQLVGPVFGEDRILKAAHVLESAMNFRQYQPQL